MVTDSSGVWSKAIDDTYTIYVFPRLSDYGRTDTTLYFIHRGFECAYNETFYGSERIREAVISRFDSMTVQDALTHFRVPSKENLDIQWEEYRKGLFTLTPLELL